MRYVIAFLLSAFSMLVVANSHATLFGVSGGGGGSDADAGGGSLYTIDVETGAAELVAVVGYPMTGLVAGPDSLYAYSPNTDPECSDWECHQPALLALDPSDGAILGAWLVDLSAWPSEGPAQIQDLALHSTGLYAVGWQGVFGQLVLSGPVAEYVHVADLSAEHSLSCGALEVFPGNSDRLLCTDWCESEVSSTGGLISLDLMTGAPVDAIPTDNQLIGMGLYDGELYGHVYRGGCGGLGDADRGDFVRVNVDDGSQTVIASGNDVPYIHDVAEMPVSGPAAPVESAPVPTMSNAFLLVVSLGLAVLVWSRRRGVVLVTSPK